MEILASYHGKSRAEHRWVIRTLFSNADSNLGPVSSAPLPVVAHTDPEFKNETQEIADRCRTYKLFHQLQLQFMSLRVCWWGRGKIRQCIEGRIRTRAVAVMCWISRLYIHIKDYSISRYSSTIHIFRNSPAYSFDGLRPSLRLVRFLGYTQGCIIHASIALTSSSEFLLHLAT
jgi:hypothetical protein